MTKSKTINMRALQDVLERFGADVQRWPQDQRAGLEAFVQSQPEARVLFDEFGAVDQLLDQHTTSGVLDPSHHAALTAKILGSVEHEPRNNSVRDNVVPFHPARVKTATTQSFHRLRLPNVAAAGALAASLLLGISIGVTGVADQTLTPVSEALGLNGLGDDIAALSDPIFDVVDGDAFDEDLL